MCFSVEADVVAGAALLPLGVFALREVRQANEVPFASLPLLFSLHQLVEALVWGGADGNVPSGVQHAATLTYVVFALVVLPTLVPTAVLLLEPRRARARVAIFVVLGVVVSVALLVGVLSGPVGVTVHPHALEYSTGVQHGAVWAALYVVAVIGPSLLSGHRSIVAFGVLNLVGLLVVAAVYAQAFASLWCIYAACVSVLVVVHLVLRRRLPDAERLGDRAWPLSRA